jgi:hypothetical protein
VVTYSTAAGHKKAINGGADHFALAQELKRAREAQGRLGACHW